MHKKAFSSIKFMGQLVKESIDTSLRMYLDIFAVLKGDAEMYLLLTLLSKS